MINFFLLIFNCKFKEDFYFFIKLTVLFFYNFFVQFVVEINSYFNKIKYIANNSFIANNFVLKIIFIINTILFYLIKLIYF